MLPLIDAATRELLLANGRQRGQDHRPIVKLFNLMGSATWLLCELDVDGNTLFGLCDLGVGEPELGYVSLDELKEVSAGLNVALMRDRSFRGKHPINAYPRLAKATGRIVDDRDALEGAISR
jgi:hypothetical protein